MAKLADQLRNKTEEILKRFEASVRKEVKAARYLSSSELKNSLPKVLENLAQALETTEKTAVPEIKVAKEHGKERSTFPQYTLEQIISEYRLLRRSIFDVLKEQDIDSQDRDTIIDAIEIGISEAASEFASQQYQLREQFISTLAHDLRNPLSAAMMSAQLILRVPEHTEQVQIMAARIIDTIGRTDRLIKDLLDSNLVRMGQKLPLEIRSGNIKSIVKQSMEEVASIHGDRFELEAEPDITGHWDLSLLQRAIGNLLTNAVKYGSKSHPVKTTVTSKREEIEIAVHNCGDPIPKSIQEHIFDSFHRAGGAKKGRTEGWGVGLYLVKGAAISHGGKVRVESEEKGGTTFTITLPRDSRPHQSSDAADR